MSKHRSNPSRKKNGDSPDFRVNENGTVPFGPPLDCSGTKIFTGSENAANPHKYFLVLTILCEICWIIFLVVLAVTR
jgi:hypothetical protein